MSWTWKLLILALLAWNAVLLHAVLNALGWQWSRLSGPPPVAWEDTGGYRHLESTLMIWGALIVGLWIGGSLLGHFATKIRRASEESTHPPP